MMNKTRDRILDEALEQMNSKGLENVSTYDIARALGIRQSNITYYFATKPDIVKALAKRMIVEADEISTITNPQAYSIADLYSTVEKTMRVHQRYRFILMSYAPIITSDKELHDHYVTTLKRRPAQMQALITMLDANGYLRGNEMLANNLAITLTLNMLAIYWIQESAIYMAGKSDKAKRRHHLELFFQVFKPYLTPKGKAQLEQVLC